MRHHPITRSAVIGVALAALAAPVAPAQQDLRMPDTRDAATRFAERTVTEPGFPAYPTPGQRSEIRQDLRSPDTRDAAEGRGTSDAPQVTVVKVPQPAPPRPAASTGATPASEPSSRSCWRRPAAWRSDPAQRTAPADGDLGVKETSTPGPASPGRAAMRRSAAVSATPARDARLELACDVQDRSRDARAARRVRPGTHHGRGRCPRRRQGSFRITCEPLAPCGYMGHVKL